MPPARATDQQTRAASHHAGHVRMMEHQLFNTTNKVRPRPYQRGSERRRPLPPPPKPPPPVEAFGRASLTVRFRPPSE